MHTVPYGAWNSFITTDLIVGEVVAPAEPIVDGGDIYWIEGRPSEKGRSVIVRRMEDGVIRDVLAPPFSCRSRVHEYGGASYVAADGTVWFVNLTDQRIWRLDEDTEPVPLRAPLFHRLFYAAQPVVLDEMIVYCVDATCCQMEYP
jgi:hypothetical protein